MRITSKQLHNLLVKTQSGQELGSLDYFDIDIESHSVQHYYIASHNLVERFLKLGKDLMIHPTQVISINENEMIVQDSLIEELEKQEGSQVTRNSFLKKNSGISFRSQDS